VYSLLLKPLFFLLPPERAHHFTLSLLEFVIGLPGGTWLMKKLFSPGSSFSSEKTVAGIRFKNIVGLAAGFDKDAKHLEVLSLLGFGFIEIGTVTPLPQPGNDLPRLFRLPKDEALINRMGFNNLGVDLAAARISRYRQSGGQLVIGGNIGRNKSTPNEKAADDYVTCFQKLFDQVDYFVVNVSSPNTPGLRELQEKEPLKNLLLRLQALNLPHENPKPIFLKIAPDLSAEQVNDIAEIILETKLAGVIATNTSISRSSLTTSSAVIDKIGAGGLSGKPIAQQSNEIIRRLKEKSGNRFAIIGAGGIHTADEARKKLDAGADLLQVYTGMIYEGPSIVKNILAGLRKNQAGG
jgi:dihydroorotate dehydrogenase